MARPLPLLRSIALAARRSSLQHSCSAEHRKAFVHPLRVVVNRQGEEAYAIGVGNASHGLVALRADERCAWLAFVDLLLRSAGTCAHIPVSLCLRPQAQGIRFTMGNGLFFQGTESLGGLLLRVYALYDARIEQIVIRRLKNLRAAGDRAMRSELQVLSFAQDDTLMRSELRVLRCP